MNILEKGLENGSVIKTDNKKKLVLDNLSKEYEVYKIKLDYLYYNDRNDRIATWISEYKLENNKEEFDMSDIKEYNNLIHEFITDNNPDKIKKTENNIKLIGQQEVGVVLSDGRIVDGNRRFTCLRNIEKTDGTQYLEAVILPHTIESNAKQIKMLELMLQHGVDEKLEYTPIDRLVGIYNDIIDTELLTVDEYIKSTNWNKAELEVEIEKAKLMVEFLEFNGTPKKFHIARTLGIADPLKELYGMLKKINNEDEKENLKLVVFAQFVTQPFGDMTRYMREVKKIASSKFINEYVEEQREIVEKVCDQIEAKKDNTEAVSLIDDLGKDFYYSTEKFKSKVNSDANRNQPAKQVEKAYDIMELIDMNIFKKLSDEQKEKISNQLVDLEELISEIKNKLKDN
ncbi:MAG: hypothetical protein R3Y13_05600 [bacterium]